MQTPSTTTEKAPFDDGELFDLLFDNNFDYGLEFYVNLARQANSPILDVACGTGRVMLPCLQAGLTVDGLDFFEPMLARLRTKANALGLKPQLFQSDMSSFRLNRRYALIIIPFNSFVHNLTADDQLGCLNCCREHLQPGGLLAFDAFFPGAALVTAPANIRQLELEKPHPVTGLPVRNYDTHQKNPVEQLLYSFNELELLDAAGNVATVHKSKTTIRWIYKNEMELLLRLADFDHWEISGGFDGRSLVNDTDAMIVKAWTK